MTLLCLKLLTGHWSACNRVCVSILKSAHTLLTTDWIIKTVRREIFPSNLQAGFNFSLLLMCLDWKCWPGVRVSQYWPLESLSITVKPAELLRARQDGRGRRTVSPLSLDSWPVSTAPKAQVAVTTECRQFDGGEVKTPSSQWNWTKESALRPGAPGEETHFNLAASKLL